MFNEPLAAARATADGGTVLVAVVRGDKAKHNDQDQHGYAHWYDKSVEFLLGLWRTT